MVDTFTYVCTMHCEGNLQWNNLSWNPPCDIIGLTAVGLVSNITSTGEFNAYATWYLVAALKIPRTRDLCLAT